jgi:hypothetical protein
MGVPVSRELMTSSGPRNPAYVDYQGLQDSLDSAAEKGWEVVGTVIDSERNFEHAMVRTTAIILRRDN